MATSSLTNLSYSLSLIFLLPSIFIASIAFINLCLFILLLSFFSILFYLMDYVTFNACTFNSALLFDSWSSFLFTLIFDLIYLWLSYLIQCWYCICNSFLLSFILFKYCIILFSLLNYLHNFNSGITFDLTGIIACSCFLVSDTFDGLSFLG